MTVVDTHAHVFPEITRAESLRLTGSEEGPGCASRTVRERG